MLVSGLDVSSADNTVVDVEYEVEDGLVLHLSDENKLVIQASDVPLWLELWYGPKQASGVRGGREERKLFSGKES